MDFLAGALCGGSVAAIAALIMLERAMTAVDKAVASLERAAEERKKETYDDADNWKLGRIEDDDD